MTVTAVVPILLVSDVSTSATWFADRLGFVVDFLHGEPPFYGSVSRDGVRIHLRYVVDPVFAGIAAREEQLIAASFEVSDVRALYAEIEGRGAEIAQPLIAQPWGGTDFHVRDPDGNIVSFVGYGEG